MKRSVFFIIGILIIAGGAYAAPRVAEYMERREAIAEQENVVRPPVTDRPSSSASSVREAQSSSLQSSQPSSPPRSDAAAINLAVPFVVQAPHGEWTPDHDDACEEASALMAIAYFQGRTFSGPDEVDRELIALVRRNEEMGYAIDQTIAQVRELMLDAMPSLDIDIHEDPTEESLKDALRDGAVIIVPAAGRMLGNPYFQSPGPDYHMLVVRGFTDDGYAITNDPGTRRGEAFVYRWSVLLDAIHDWNGDGENITQGKKAVLVVRE